MPILVLISAIINTLFGVAVFWTNPYRNVNRTFLPFTLVFTAWLVSFGMGSYAASIESAKFWIKQSLAIGSLIPCVFYLLSSSILFDHSSWKKIIEHSRIWLVVSGSLFFLCQLDLMVESAIVFDDGKIPDAVFGPIYPLFIIFQSLAYPTIVIQIIRKTLKEEGVAKIELQFILLACFLGGISGVLFAVLLPLFLQSSQPAQFQPLFVLVVNVTIAYGIATQRIMGVGVLLRRITAYALLTAYLIGIYFVAFLSCNYLSSVLDIQNPLFPHLIATLVVVFSMSRAQSMLQTIINKLFGNLHSIDFVKTMQNADKILNQIDTIENISKQAIDILQKATGTDRIALYLKESDNTFKIKANTSSSDLPDTFEFDSLLIKALTGTEEPVFRESLKRLATTPELISTVVKMKEMQIALAVGIKINNHFQGFVLLSDRLSGRIYENQEQETLQIFCNHLAVSFQNSKLFEEIRRSDRLATVGTLAAGMAHEIKNPLVAIKTYAQLLPEQYDEEVFRTKCASMINTEVDRINHLVRSLMNLSKPSTPVFIPSNVHPVLDEVIEITKQSAPGKGIEITSQFKAENDRISGDKGLLHQAFLNFCLNALDAMETNGKLSITTESGTHFPNLNKSSENGKNSSKNGYLCVSIRDTGCGMTESQVNQIFDPFFSTKKSGNGLGLAVTHRILNEHRAEINIQSKPEVGTTFNIFFPLLHAVTNER